ncbi:YgaB family protein [Cytobacillus sp. S13-E01]|uniref:YgaB family protein n=1 Tax=Cytobacillus sp. S13-E01 TaxID=3031326 RepID=UPI0023D86A02|nr:YgaB family protein [Cytobacillus sp. S13-E01]MDF0725926.1 YgaB family protein [Cytobacillus sp. S13-E01]
MDTFNQLINEQLKTMDKLLFLQSEIERCQDIESVLIDLEDKTELTSIQEEIDKMKIELRQIQRTFELQTEEVIRTYQDKKQPIA